MSSSDLPDEIYLKIYHRDTKTYQISQESIQYPNEDTVSGTIASIQSLYNQKYQVKILRKTSDKFVTETGKNIGGYLEKIDQRYYVKIQLIPKKEDIFNTYWIHFKGLNSLQGIPQKFSFGNSSTLGQIKASIIEKLNTLSQLQFQNDNLLLTVSTVNHKSMAFDFSHSLQQFEKSSGQIIKIQCQLIAFIKIQHSKSYSISVKLNLTIREVLSLLSSKDMEIIPSILQVFKDQERISQISQSAPIQSIFSGKQVYLYLKKIASYQFLAFDESEHNQIDQVTLMNFVSFYKKEQIFKRSIKAQNKSYFSSQWRKITVDLMKRGFGGKAAMTLNNMQTKLAQSLDDFSLWNSPRLNNDFIHYYLIQRCNSFSKILFCELIKSNFPLPTHIISGSNRKLKIIEENIFHTLPGLAVVSIQLSPQDKKSSCFGKSELLNHFFYINLESQQNRHPSLDSIPLIQIEPFQNQFPLNIIDIPKNVDPHEQDRLLKGANVIILHSWQTQSLTQKKVKQLVAKYNCFVLVLYRDRLKSTTTSVKFTYDKRKQEENFLQVQNMKGIKIDNLNVNILRNHFGQFIFGANKELQVGQDQKILQIYSDTKSYLPYLEFMGLINTIKKNITNIKIGQDGELNYMFKKMLKFIYEKQSLEEQRRFCYVFINSLKKMKSYVEKPYLQIYQIRKKLGINSDSFKKPENFGLYKEFVRNSNKDLNKIFPGLKQQQLLSSELTIEQNILLINNKISIVQKDIVPYIFSSEIAMRQLLKANQKQTLDKQRNLADVYNFLNVFQVQRGAPFQIIDGDNLEMPLENIKRSFEQVQGKVCVVSVLGPQSSGKSTILNYLFGCNFRASQGRCTKGVYGSYYNINSETQTSLGYNGLLIVDTEGINSQSKNKEFDRQLVTFIMSITDVLIIVMKGDLDKAVGDLIALCYQNCKNRFQNYGVKIILVLNQNNTNDLSLNSKQINDFKKKIDINYQVQLSRAFSTLSINNTHLPFLNQKTNYVIRKPLQSFMSQVVVLQLHIIETMNLTNSSQYKTIDEKMESFSRNWEIVKSFSDIYKYASREQIQLVHKMDQWIVSRTNIIQKKHENLLQSYQKKRMTQQMIKDEQKEERDSAIQDCERQLEQSKNKILQQFSKGQTWDPKIGKNKQLQLQQFIRSVLLKKYTIIINDYQKIFDQRKTAIQEKHKIINIQLQGISDITLKAYQLRAKQKQNNKQLPRQQITKQFQEIWRKTLLTLQTKLNNKDSFSTIANLTRDQYNIIMKKYETDSSLNMAFLTLPEFLTKEITKQNIMSQEHIAEVIKKTLTNKKESLLKHSKKDPIFIYNKYQNLGTITAKKQYLNLQQSFLKQAVVQNQIGIQQEGLVKIINEIFDDLKYQGLLKSINRQLAKFSFEIESVNTLKQIMKYKPPILIDIFDRKPSLDVKSTTGNTEDVDPLFIKVNTIKSQSQLSKKWDQIFDMGQIKKYLQSKQNQSYVEKQINSELNLIQLNIKIIKNGTKYQVQFSIISVKKYQGSEQFKQQVRKFKHMKKIENYAKYNKILDEKTYYQVGFYNFIQFQVDESKNLPEQLKAYFKLYISPDQSIRIKNVKRRSLDASRKFDFFTKIFQNIRKRALLQIKAKKNDLNSSGSVSVEQSIKDMNMEVMINYISEEFESFDQDFRQMAIESTQLFKGYCHLYVIYLVVSNQIKKDYEQGIRIIKDYNGKKDKLKQEFQKRASISQKLSSQAAFLTLSEKIIKYFENKLQYTENSIIQNAEKDINSNIYQKLNFNDIMAKSNSLLTNQPATYPRQDYFANKYNFLEKARALLLDERINTYRLTVVQQEKKSLDDFYSVLLSVINVFLELQNNIKSQFIQDILDQKNFFEGGDEKNTGKRLYQYFTKIYQYCQQKQGLSLLQTYQNNNFIIKSMRIRVSVQSLHPNLLRYHKELVQIVLSEKLQVSNLYYFLNPSSVEFIKELTKTKEGVKLSLAGKLEAKLKKRVDFTLCLSKRLCPCCSQVCFLQGGHPKHQSAYHQVRGWGKTVIVHQKNPQQTPQSYLSTLTCQQLAQTSRMFVNGQQRTWKDVKSVQFEKSWNLPSKQKLDESRRKLAKEQWNDFGQKYAKKVNRRFKKASLKDQLQYDYHLLFVIDQSGSMSDYWNQIKQLYEKLLLNQKSKSFNTVISTILFSHVQRIHCYFQPIRQAKPLPQLSWGNTNYAPPMDRMIEFIQKTSESFQTIVFFLTDGQCHDEGQATKRIPRINQLMQTKQLNFISLYFDHQRTSIKGTNFERIFTQVKNGQMFSAKNISELDEIIHNQIEFLTNPEGI